MSKAALIVGGIVLYGISTVATTQAEQERPTPPNQSRFSAHPLSSLGSLIGALTATYGLSRVKPSYAVYGLAGYFASEWYVVPALSKKSATLTT